jgi:hypothetical protein
MKLLEIAFSILSKNNQIIKRAKTRRKGDLKRSRGDFSEYQGASIQPILTLNFSARLERMAGGIVKHTSL